MSGQKGLLGPEANKLIFDEVKRDRKKTYFVISLDLSVARSNFEMDIAGFGLTVLGISPTSLNSSSVLSVRLNDSVNDAIPLNQGVKINALFHRLFFTNTAQVSNSSATLVLATDLSLFDIFQYGGDLQALYADPYSPIKGLACSTVNFYNLTCTSASTEYSQALPANTRILILSARTAAVKWCFTSGQSGSNFQTLTNGVQPSVIECINLLSATIYAQSGTAGAVLEIVAFS